MSRSGYDDYYEGDVPGEFWRSAVYRALYGKRGQAFLREMLVALDGMEQKRLITDDLVREGEVCAIGAVAVARGVDVADIDPYDRDQVAQAFGIAPAMAAEIMYENDERGPTSTTPEQRFERMRAWVVEQLR